MGGEEKKEMVEAAERELGGGLAVAREGKRRIRRWSTASVSRAKMKLSEATAAA